jgi:hypothetical protein
MTECELHECIVDNFSYFAARIVKFPLLPPAFAAGNWVESTAVVLFI